MTRRIAIVLMGSLFLLALALNGYLLATAVDGARVVQQVESAAGHGLTCFELYQARSIDAYYAQRPAQGFGLFLLSLTWMLWFPVSIGSALGLAAVIGGPARWRWLPVAGMSLLVLGLVLYLPAIGKIMCATE